METSLTRPTTEPESPFAILLLALPGTRVVARWPVCSTCLLRIALRQLLVRPLQGHGRVWAVRKMEEEGEEVVNHQQ